MLSKFFLAAGTGNGNTSLTSFDAALIQAGIGDYNLVKVSSILPRNAVSMETIEIDKGQLLHVAYASITSKEEDAIISAAVAIGIPKDRSHTGVIMEYSGRCSRKEAEVTVVSMVDEAMDLRHEVIGSIKVISSSCKTVSDKFSTAIAAVALL